MTEVLVVSHKWDGSFHRRTRAVELGTDEAGTVLLTLEVPSTADPEDAAQLAADAATSTALRVVHATAVECHLPVPGTRWCAPAGTSRGWS